MKRIKRISVSVGIFCHNEEDNIARALESVLNSKTEVADIKEIVVVSSGSFDKTNRIVRSFMRKDKRIKLIDEAQRSGKSSAINAFIHAVTGQVLISLSGDLRVKNDAIEEIVLPFLNSSIGMVGGHPMPMNCRFSEVGREMSLLWELHHRISLKKPKCGEMVAFRNVIRQIPIDSAVDEANLEVLLRMIGFVVSYAPRAVIYNKVPATLKEVIMQRRRVFAGHLWLSERYNYQVSTMQEASLIQTILDYLDERPRDFVIMLRLLAIEFVSRSLGWFDYAVLKRNPYIWNMVKR